MKARKVLPTIGKTFTEKNNESQPNRDGTLRGRAVINRAKNPRAPVIQSERVKSENLRGGKVCQLLTTLEKNNKKQHPLPVNISPPYCIYHVNIVFLHQ